MYRGRAALVGAGLSLLGIAAIFWVGIARGVFLLDGDTGARWLVASPRTRGVEYPIRTLTAAYRRVFRVENPEPSAALELRAVERASVWLDGAPIHLDLEPDRRGRTLRTIPLGAVGAGAHMLVIYVAASAGPPALSLRSDRLAVAARPRAERGR